jgi:hypothetical protein
MRVIGIEPDHSGEIPNKDIPRVRQGILRALNKDEQRAVEHRPVEIAGRIYSQGITDEYVLRRLKDIDSVLVAAQELGESITWG